MKQKIDGVHSAIRNASQDSTPTDAASVPPTVPLDGRMTEPLADELGTVKQARSTTAPCAMINAKRDTKETGRCAENLARKGIEMMDFCAVKAEQ